LFEKKPHPINPGRREVLHRLALAGMGSLCLPAWLRAGSPLPDPEAITRPHLYWRTNPAGTLRTVDSVRESIKRPGLAQEIWKAIEAACVEEFGAAPLTCRSLIPGRMPVMAEQNNPDYTICHAAGQRILRHAVALHLTGEERHKKAALEQLDALFDESVWPDWIDQAHLRFELPAGLRTGMLSQDCGLAYDWLYPFLDDTERGRIVEGLDRRGIQPFLKSMEADPWWAHDLNNWYTVIIGGLGIAGMALAGDHPDAGRLVEISRPRMQRYLSIYGADGSFNESVAYSSATRLPVAYFNALYYHSSGGDNPLARKPFPQTAEWTLYAALPGGRFAAFGDGRPELDDRMGFVTAISAATRDPVIQDFAVRHLGTSANPYALLWFDPDLPRSSPAGKLPLGRVFPENSGLIFSRSSWDPDTPEMIVYGKSRQAQNHGHNDVGQVCIDMRGQPMIVDTGSPSSYPEDFFDENRFRYYNASVSGHNVLMFGGREQKFPPHDRGVKGLLDLDPMSGRYLQTHFDDQTGAYWQMDLTNAYPGAKRVRRTVIHLLPGYAVVLDEAELEQADDISLRWHTVLPATPDADGSFAVVNVDNRLACRVEALDGKTDFLGLRRHAYAAPYNRDRTGQLLEQRNEPYVELRLKGRACRILSLFGDAGRGTEGFWEKSDDRWELATAAGRVEVMCSENSLRIRHHASGRELSVDLG
jgi:hypothetical protein